MKRIACIIISALIIVLLAITCCATPIHTVTHPESSQNYGYICGDFRREVVRPAPTCHEYGHSSGCSIIEVYYWTDMICTVTGCQWSLPRIGEHLHAAIHSEGGYVLKCPY